MADTTIAPPPPATPVEDVAAAYYVQQQRVARTAADRVQATWRRLDPSIDLVSSWTAPGGVGDTIVDTVAAAQRATASAATPYIDRAVAAQGAASEWDGELVPEAWWGRAADGRNLSTLLWQPLRDTTAFIDAGMPTQAALDRGLADLVRMVVSEVADAGRGPVGAGIAANRRTRGYVRHLNPPSCARCVILAGREYAFNTGFRRHPRCDCVHIPITVGAPHGRTQDPDAYFASLPRQEQDRLLGRAAAAAVRDHGADLTSLVNARRGITTTRWYGRDIRNTLEGTTRRGWFYRTERRLAEARGQGPFHVPGTRDGLPTFQLRSPRLLPEDIYAMAGSDRDLLVRLLKKNGYLR